MNIGERIAAARKAAGVSQARLGDLVGAVQTTVSSWERGRTEPTREDAQRIAAALGIPTAELELGDNPPSSADVRVRRTVPLVGYVGAGGQAHYGSGDVLGEVDAPENATETTVAAEMRGESMGPLLDGWLVFWDEVRSPVTPDMHGQLCVVGLPDDKVFVKQIRPASTEGLFHLISNTEGPMLDKEVLWAALVTELRPR